MQWRCWPEHPPPLKCSHSTWQTSSSSSSSKLSSSGSACSQWAEPAGRWRAPWSPRPTWRAGCVSWCSPPGPQRSWAVSRGLPVRTPTSPTTTWPPPRWSTRPTSCWGEFRSGINWINDCCGKSSQGYTTRAMQSTHWCGKFWKCAMLELECYIYSVFSGHNCDAIWSVVPQSVDLATYHLLTLAHWHTGTLIPIP